MNNLKLIGIISVIVAIVSKISGLLRDVLLSYYYGAGSISDAYMIAYTLPLIIVGLVGEAVSTAFLPAYSRLRQKSIKEANKFMVKLVNLLLIFTTFIITIFLIFKNIILLILFPGLNNNTFVLISHFTNITIWSLYPLFIIYILTSLAQVRMKLFRIAILSLPMNMTFLLTLFISNIMGPQILPYGILIGISSQVFVLWKEFSYLLKKFKITVDFKDVEVNRIFKLSIPVMIGVSVNQLNGIVDMNMASYIKEGGISIINYANRINLLFHGVIGITLANICYPIFSKLINDKDFLTLNKFSNNVLKIITLLTAPAIVYLILFSDDIVKILYGQGSISLIELNETSAVMKMYSFSILPIAFREILVRIFYSLGNTSFPFYSSLIGVILNITLNLLLSHYLGLPGLALASSISAAIALLILMYLLKKKYKVISFKEISINFFKISFINILLYFSINITINICKPNIIGDVMIIFMSALLYFCILIIFKIVDKSDLIFVARKN